jgi:hypothetical protein
MLLVQIYGIIILGLRLKREWTYIVWLKLFGKVFNPRVLLLIVANAAYFYGNMKASEYAIQKDMLYRFDIVAYVWFALVGLEILKTKKIIRY